MLVRPRITNLAEEVHLGIQKIDDRTQESDLIVEDRLHGGDNVGDLQLS